MGQFRRNHPAFGAGIHKEISASPYVFSRTFTKNNFTDHVVVGLDLLIGKKELSVGSVFKDGTKLRDAYSGIETIVSGGKATIDSEYGIVLLELKN